MGKILEPGTTLKHHAIKWFYKKFMRLKLAYAKKFCFNKLFSLVILLVTTKATAGYAPLVIDTPDIFSLPKNFRTSWHITDVNNRSAQQLIKLRALGSAQFSIKQLQLVLKRSAFPVAIIDLRQECHGFINGHAVSWYGLHNWSNQHNTMQAIETEQARQLRALANTKQTIACTLTKLPDEKVKLTPMHLTIHQALSEAQLAEQFHLPYLRLYVTDKKKPNDQQIDRFIQFVKNLPPNVALYFHCRAGKGRTTTFMVMYDMMKNARYSSFTEIMQRQYLIGGKNLLVLPKKTSYKYQFALERMLFLKNFYRYCQEQTGCQFKMHWSDWISSKIAKKYTFTKNCKVKKAIGCIY